jgi:tripartite-type tricarboxylate transporter receptor subunit TctC
MKGLVRSAASLTLAALICFVAAAGWAQSFPQRPIRLIVPSSPGGGADTIARILANALPPVLGQEVVVDNRSGASGNIGAEIAARSPPDGHTWLLIGNAHAANYSLFKGLSYNLLTDFVPVTQTNATPHVVVVHPSVPVKSVGELVALAKAKPDHLNYASAGKGSVTYLAAEIFKDQAGVEITHIPYKGGGDSLRSVVAGETQVYFSPVPVALEYIKNGSLRALAVTSKGRVTMLPDVPTVAESGYPAYEFSLWNGLVVPKGTPDAIVAVIRNAVIQAAKTPQATKLLESSGSMVVGSGSEEFRGLIKAEVDTLAKLVTKLGLTAD